MSITTRHHPSTDQTAPVPQVRARPDFQGLDGLRALAVTAVVIYHLNPSWLPGGFLGVDMFFVVSGFLITSLLTAELTATGTLDLRSFWVRRARRLLPALAVCVVVSLLLARLVSGDLLVGAPRQVLGAATFSTNWLEMAAGQSYFERTAPTLFLNFWSLAVEEQFYLLWPLVVFLLFRRLRPVTRIGVAASVGVLSAVAMGVLFAPGQDATRVYYGTDTHLIGLMLGAAAAFAWAGPTRFWLQGALARSRHWLLSAGAATLLGLMALLGEQSAFTYRGGLSLACLATAVLLVVAVDHEPGRAPSRYQRLLNTRALVWIGRRSYGIYLWHWPVLLIADALVPTAPGSLLFLCSRGSAVAVTLGVAHLSYRFVEVPLRRRGFADCGRSVLAWLLAQSRRSRQLLSLAAALVIVAFALTLVTAPAESQTARVLRANEAAASAGAAGEPGSAVRPDQVIPLPEAEVAKAFAMPTGAEIDGFGDSMMVGSVHALEYYFPGIRVDARSNRHWSDGLKAVRQRGTGMRRAVVLNFGTNAGTDLATLNKTLDTLGPDRMVVVVNESGSFSRVTTDNAQLARAVQRRPNVVVADWNGASRKDPSALQADKIHPSLSGSHVYADTVRRAFARLSQKHTGQAVPLPDLPRP